MHITYNQHLKEYARNLRNHKTFAERNLWQMLKGKQINGFDFHRQKPIGNFIADFYCYALRLVIEVDGITHEDKKVQINDKRKDEYFTEIGLTVMRFTDDEVIGNSDLVERRIREFAKSNLKKHTP
ncbi:MAG: endonuclease domain-containing protein [bacterium]